MARPRSEHRVDKYVKRTLDVARVNAVIMDDDDVIYERLVIVPTWATSTPEDLERDVVAALDRGEGLLKVSSVKYQKVLARMKMQDFIDMSEITVLEEH